MPLKELNFITGNCNKLAEVQAIIGSVVRLQNQSLDLVETQGSIEEISKDKCRRAAEIVSAYILIFLKSGKAPDATMIERKRLDLISSFMFFTLKVGGPVLTEDTCLCFNALKELPGPYM